MFGQVTTFMALLLSAIKSEIHQLNLYVDKETDLTYSINLQQEFFADEHHIVFTDNSSKPLSKNSTFVIAPPISNNTKISHSILFWPPKGNRVAEENCTFTMGLHGLGNSLMYQDVSLINSMTYFEVVRVKNETNETSAAMHFITFSLDKTSPDYKISRQIESQHPGYLEEGHRCDEIIYFGTNKTYIFCWKRIAVSDQEGLKYKLEVVTIVWDPRKGARTDRTQFDVFALPENSHWFNDTNIKGVSLRAELCKSLEGTHVDIAIFFRTTPCLMIMRYQDDKFTGGRYPFEYQTRSAGEKFLLDLTINEVAVKINDIIYIDDLKFIIKEYAPDFKGTNSSTYGGAYYLDAAVDKRLLIGKGMVLSFRKGIDSYKKPVLEDVTIITDSSKEIFDPVENKTYVDISIQIKKHYLGSFYGEKKFKIKSYGRPHYFRGFASERYIVYIDHEDPISGSPCTQLKYVNSRIYIALPEKPHIIKQLIKFEDPYKNPVRILVSSNNNLIYLRFPHKLEVFNLDHLLVDLKQIPSFPEFQNRTNSIDISSSKTKPDLSDTSKALTNTKAILTFNTCPPESDNLYVTLKDRMLNNTNNRKERVKKIERKFKYQFPFLFSYLDINGNFLSFDSDPHSMPTASISPFDSKFMKTQEEELTKANISSIYGMVSNRQQFVLICYKNNLGNIIFRFNSKDSTYKKHFPLYDNRQVTSIQEVTNDRYLIHIEGLLYDLNLITSTLTPVFKSNDLCGEVYTLVSHNEFGQLTVCGGFDRITIFASNQENDIKVDLSSPLSNFRINPSLAQALKTETIKSLFSSPNLRNRFGSMSKIITANSSAIYNNRNSSSSVTIRFFEIGSSRQSIDVLAESVLEVTFEETASVVLPYILNNRLVLLIRFPRVLSPTTARIIEEERIQVYIIDSACNLILEKIIPIPYEFDTDMEENKPLVTFLPVNKTLQTKTYGQKLLIMFDVKKKSQDILQHFDFFDFDYFDQYNPNASQRQKLIGVLDANQTSTNCIKILQLPDKFETVSFGPYFLDESDFMYGLGAIVVGIKDKEQRIYFMNDHSLVVDFSMFFKSFDDYLISPEVWKFRYFYTINNHLNNRNKAVTMDININPVLNATYKISTYQQSMFEVDLSKSNETPKLFSFLTVDLQQPNRLKDVITGMPYQFTFEYDSKIEEISNQLEANLKISVNKYLKSKIDDLFKLLQIKPKFKARSSNVDETLRNDWTTLNPHDYIDILYLSSHIGTPRVILEKKNTEIRPNPFLLGKRRCKKFFYKAHAEADHEEEMLACLELSSNTNLLLLYIFDERNDDSNLYDVNEPLKNVTQLPFDIQETPIDNVYLSATMNYVIIEFANKRTLVTYRYEVYRILKPKDKPNTIEAELVHTGMLWNSQLAFSNYYYFAPELNKTVERFCSVSVVKIDKPLLSYYCVYYDETNLEFSEDPISIEKDVFSPFKVEDIDSVSPLINIYTKSLNPIADNTNVEYDSRLYVVITFQTSFTVFLSLDPINPQADFNFTFFCNPFEGYLFLGEEQVVSGQYIAKIGVRYSDTYVIFYNVPPVYGPPSNSSHPRYYTVSQLKDAFESDQLLTCIEPTYIKKLDLEVNAVFPLHFYRGSKSQKSAPNSSTVVYSIVGDRSSFSINRKSLQFIVAANGLNDFYRVEYMPAFEVKAASQLVLSNTIKVNIKGMRNRTGDVYIYIKSGSFFQPGFFIIYMLPLVVLVAGLVFINWLLRCIFNGQSSDSSNEESLPSIFRPKDFAISISSLKKRISVQTAKKKKENEQQGIENQLRNNMKRNQELEWIRKEAILKAQRMKEVVGITSPVLESDLTHEIQDLARFRNLREKERLKVKLIVEDEEEKEVLMEIPSKASENYAKFKEFMEEQEQIEMNRMNRKKKISFKATGDEMSFESESSALTPDSKNKGSQSSEDATDSSDENYIGSPQKDKPDGKELEMMSDKEDEEEVKDPTQRHKRGLNQGILKNINRQQTEAKPRVTFEFQEHAEDHL